MHHRRFKRLCAALPLFLLAVPDGLRSQEISKLDLFRGAISEVQDAFVRLR